MRENKQGKLINKFSVAIYLALLLVSVQGISNLVFGASADTDRWVTGKIIFEGKQPPQKIARGLQVIPLGLNIMQSQRRGERWNGSDRYAVLDVSPYWHGKETPPNIEWAPVALDPSLTV